MALCADLRKLACIACILWLCALPGLACAQARDTGVDAAASAGDPAGGGAAATATPSVLFLLPYDEEQTQAELRDALLAQFTLIEATLVFEPKPQGEASLATRVQQAQALAAEHAAIAVFWIDAAADGRWLLHMMDTQDQRVIVRQVDAAGERRPAAVEAVAVMTRSGTRALIEGTPEPLPPAKETPATPAPAPAESAQTLDAFRLWLGYTGNAFAPGLAWQHGAALGATWLGLHPFFAGLSLTLAPTIKPEPTETTPATFSVQRTPIAAQFGYRYVTGRVAFDGELGIAVERWFRSAAEARQLTGQSTDPSDTATTRWVYELAPRLRCELRIARVIGLYGGGGLDILLNKFNYISDGEPTTVLLQPNPFRPVAELGISFYP